MAHFGNPRPMLRQHCFADAQCLFPEQGLCPPVCRLCSSRGWASQVPWEPLLWQIPFGFKGPWEGQQGHLAWSPQSPTLRVTCRLPWREPKPSPKQAAPVLPIVCGPGVFSQLTCLQVERCEKLGTKWSLQSEGELSCTERKEIPLWDFIFPPLSIQKIQRDSVFNANVGFESLRFGLTLQKKKKNLTGFQIWRRKTVFPSIHGVHLQSQRLVGWIVGASLPVTVNITMVRISSLCPHQGTFNTRWQRQE